MLPDGAEAFWLAFVALLAYECLDKQGPFELRLVQGTGGWICRLPALRIRDGYLAFHGPLGWLRVELCVNWLRVKDVAAESVARTATPQNLHSLRWPIGALALALLVVLPLVAWLGSVANWAPANLLLVAIGLIYGSAAWLAWSLGALGRQAPAARGALRSLGLEIFFCPLFGLGAMRKAARLLLVAQLADSRGALIEGEWQRLAAWADRQLRPLEAYWKDVPASPEGDAAKSAWQARLAAARQFYGETADAAG